jgi:hypothetical protein
MESGWSDICPVPGNAAGRRRTIPHTLPLWLFMLSLWRLAVVRVRHIPVEMTLLGWASYSFFVPLLYVGAELAAADRLAAKALKVRTWLELGIMGVVLYEAVFWVVLAPAIRSLRWPGRIGVALTMMAITLGVSFLKGQQSLNNPLIHSLFWLSVGGLQGRMQADRALPIAGFPSPLSVTGYG